MNREQQELQRRIAGFDLDGAGAAFPFTAKLAKENGWSRAHAERVVVEYRKFVFLAVAAGHPVSPSEDVDQAWHLHLTYTRSYWNRLCPEVLGRPLHHEPSKGGLAERSKFAGWYAQTLESYRRFFGHEPPVDIWPDAETRFSDDLRCRRVNVARNWIVPKRPLRWLVAASAVLTAALLTLAGRVAAGAANAAVEAAAETGPHFVNPFDLPGPQFLILYAFALVLAIVIAGGIRWFMSRSSTDLSPEARSLDRHEVAYLSGDAPAARDAALASLVASGALRVSGEERRLLPGGDSGSTPLHPLEADVLLAVGEGCAIDDLKSDLPVLVETARRLESLDLIVSESRDRLGRWIPVLVILTVPLMGVIKLFVGVSRNMPVELLFWACLFSVSIAFGPFGCRLLRTRNGDYVLEELRAANKNLAGARGELADLDVGLAVGLFGIGVLEAGPLADLHAALKPRDESHGGAGCGGDGGDGGGCGGCGGTS